MVHSFFCIAPSLVIALIGDIDRCFFTITIVRRGITIEKTDTKNEALKVNRDYFTRSNREKYLILLTKYV